MYQSLKNMSHRQNDCIPLVCVPPEEQLLRAVNDNNEDLIRRLVDNDSDLLIYKYPDYLKTILETACAEMSDRVHPETVHLLIDLGADLEQPNKNLDNMRAIHFAAESMNADILATVLDNMETKNVNFNLTKTYGDTALLGLLKNSEGYNNDGFLKCVELLASKIDVNCVDSKGIPAIFWAAKKDLKDVVNILQRYDLDVDSYKDRRLGKTARDLLEEKKWFSSNDCPTYKSPANETLAQKLNSDNLTEEDLVNLQDVNKEYYNGTLLQMLVQRSMVDLVKKLMENETLECNKTTKTNHVLPINIALERADYETLEVLIGNPKTKIPENLLCHVLNNFDRRSPSIPGRDYKRCALVCLENGRTQDLLNRQGDNGNYPLHFACRYADEDTILKILEKKTSLANRSGNGYLTINDIQKRTLEAHLDSCLSMHERETKSISDEKEIRFDFSTLLPSRQSSSDSKVISIERTENGNRSSSYQGEDNKLLDNRVEMDVPIFMSQSAELKPLLTHPILAVFVYLKWQQLSRIYYLNLTFYVILCIFLYAYIFLNYINEKYEGYSAGIKLISTIIYVVNIVCLVALLLRELFQLLLEKLRYFRDIENFIELTLICTMSAMVLPVLSNNYLAKKQVASIAILFSAIELFLLIGKKPNLSTNIVILQTVSSTFLKLLLWYSCLIIGFALSFYALFGGQKQEEGDDPNFFINPALATIKTIVMLTGEFDAGAFKFDSIPFTSHIIFLMFVFMISIVLFNLMNGLAVSDTQIIKNESELYSYVSQIQYIAYIESMLTDHPLSSYLKKLCRPSYFASDGGHVLSVELHQAGIPYGYITGSASGKIRVRQSLVKRAKVIVETRRMEEEAKKLHRAEKTKFEQMERMIQEMAKKIDAMSKNES